MVVLESRVEFVRPMDPAAIDDHHDFFPAFAEDGHHLMDILAQLLGIKMRDDLIEDFGGPILDGANDAQQDPTGDAAPGAILPPRLAFAGLLTSDLTLAQGTYREADALGGAPPARTGEGKAPQEGFICIEQDDLTSSCSVLQGGELKRAIGEISWGGGQLASGAVVAEVFFNTQRTLSRPRWTPVSRAKTVASSRQLHWEWREPCSRGF
jgi:hypothetical protein